MPTLSARLARAVLRSLPLYNGKGRLIDHSLLHKLAFDEKVLDVRTADGFTMRVWPNDLIGRHIYLTGYFDRCVVDALVKYSKPGSCLWDIGANIGYVSCAYLARVPESRVVAVEPMADTAQLLRHNLTQFDCHRYAQVVEAAISDHVGMGTMAQVEGNAGQSHLTEDGAGESVRLITGDSLADICQPDIIKIDVEGHELQVICGIAKALERFRPPVVFEHHTKGGSPDPEILQTFSALHYDVFRIGRRWNGWKLAPGDRPLRGYEPSPDFVALAQESRLAKA